MSLPVILDLQIASKSKQLPPLQQLKHWAAAAVGKHKSQAEISLRIVDRDEGAQLNQQWRNKAGPTNVLSFPADLPIAIQSPLLGDLVICAPVVEQEAREQNKPLEAHWAHIMIHGTLHLMGYDHIDDQQASEMESLEKNIMASLGFHDPYKDDDFQS